MPPLQRGPLRYQPPAQNGLRDECSWRSFGSIHRKKEQYGGSGELFQDRRRNEFPRSQPAQLQPVSLSGNSSKRRLTCEQGHGKSFLGLERPLRASQLSGTAYLESDSHAIPSGEVCPPISGKIDREDAAGPYRRHHEFVFPVLGTQLTRPLHTPQLKTVEADVEGYAGQIDAMMAQIASLAGDPDPTIIVQG